MMWLNRKVVVGDAERGLVFRNRRFERVLGPGVHRLRALFDALEVRVYDISQSEYTGKDVEAVIAAFGARLGETFLLADVGTQEVGLLLKNGKLEDVLLPGTRKLYWTGLLPLELQRVSLLDTLEIAPALAKRLRQLGLLERVAVAVTVPAEHAALVFVDGKLAATLAPGATAFWNVQKNVVAEVVDLRLQSVEVSGQELLTRDKVSLRVNLGASMRVVDPVAARTKVSKYGDYLYRELQFGLRQAIATRSLDELLADKAALDADIFGYVRERVAGLGLELIGVGVKDVILPGEMKDILNGVVQAEKTAQANVIRRREESNATRSLLNTAKLVEESPVLMRLKELETLEKLTEKVGTLTVYGGLDGLLKQLAPMK
jgi:regulator of protease activity HflC (stomatin/prohibitin superfamily)